jgi:integrase
LPFLGIIQGVKKMSKRRGNKEGSIYKRANGTWRAQVTIKGRRLIHTAKNHKDCLDWIKKTNKQIDNGMTFSSSQYTFAEHVTGWLASKKGSIRKTTLRQYEQLMRDYVIPYLGQDLVIDLRTDRIQALYTSLLSKNIGVCSVEKVHDLIHCSLQAAVDSSIIMKNPSNYAKPPRRPITEMKFLTESQVIRFLISIKGHRWEALFYLAIVTGMRQMELLGLNWTDLDWVKRTIKVDRQLSRESKGVHYLSPKTKSGRRTISVGEKTINILRIHYELQQKVRIKYKKEWVENGLIFSNCYGGPIYARNLVTEFHKLLYKAELPRIRFHDLRHTACSLMLNNNVSPIVVSKRLGHAKTSITLDVYGHLIPIMQNEAAEIIENLVTPIEITSNAPELHPISDTQKAST